MTNIQLNEKLTSQTSLILKLILKKCKDALGNPEVIYFFTEEKSYVKIYPNLTKDVFTWDFIEPLTDLTKKHNISFDIGKDNLDLVYIELY